MPLCQRHSQPELYGDIWEDWVQKYSEYEAGRFFPDFCFCRQPTAYQKRAMESALQIFREARLESQLIPPGKSKGTSKSDGQDESAGRWYLITFTQPDTIKDPTDLLKRTQKVLRSKQVSATQWCYSLELTERGTPHTHIVLNTCKYFEYKKVGAFNDGYRYDVKVEKYDVKKYAVKQESKPTPAWLATYGLDQCVWYSEHYSGPRFQEEIKSSPDV